MKEKIGAIILAAGQGRRMESKTAKQFLLLKGKPLIYYSLKAFAESAVEEIILVTGEADISYCEKEIVGAFGLGKVKSIIAGGKERIHSVYEGLKAFAQCSPPDYVLIHDGARPLVSEEVIKRSIDGAIRYQGCVAGMPVKDTIKVSGEDGYAKETLDRRQLWQIQTPQAFAFPLIYHAYQEVMHRKEGIERITDDAMVAEIAGKQKIKLVEGDYRNIKVTTPEDLFVAEALLNSYCCSHAVSTANKK